MLNLPLKPNVLYGHAQLLSIDKVATLIGGNGSGKSTILKSIFDQKLEKKDYPNSLIICFTSGQNESYSKAFSSFLNKERKQGQNLDCYFYDKNWARLLIFLATAKKRTGKVRSYLREHDYVIESADASQDVSTTLEIAVTVKKNFIQIVKYSLDQEAKGIIETVRSTPFFHSLSSFISLCIKSGYDFDKVIRKRVIQLTSIKLNRVDFADEKPEYNEDGSIIGSISKDPALSFFTQAANKDEFIDKRPSKLFLKNDLELDQLSDGEYQILFLYSLIDLFDSDETIFLLDEVDSHLHFKNIEKMWQVLHSIKGHAITTTHLIDSIAANKFESIKVVDKGQIRDCDKVKQLIDRLGILARAKSVEFEVCAKIPNMVLMDDYNDWEIFKQLAMRKVPAYDVSKILSIEPFKKESSFNSISESLGKSKIEWVSGLSKVEGELNTSRIFLICDRDSASIDFNQNDKVQVTGDAFKKQISNIKWPNNTSIKIFLLAWRRREIKHYLLSFSALNHYGKLDEINSDSLANLQHLKANDPGDNDGIRLLPSTQVKSLLHPYINTDDSPIDTDKGLDLSKLQAYIDLIPPSEISEDIENMYNFIVRKL